MATPNYGNQMQPGMPGMQMQQPQQPGMNMGPPQGAQPPPRPVRRGTSKAVPVVMSAGLAVGVFCGLLFGLGTGNDGALASTGTHAASASSASSSGKAADTGEVADVLKTPSAADGTAKKIENTPAQLPPPAATGSATGSAAAPPAAPAATGSATGSAAAPGVAAVATTGSGAAPALASAAKIKVVVSPATVTDAKITVDGKDLTPDMTIALDGAAKKTVDVVIHATGYHEYEQKVDVTPGDTTVNVELVKRPAATASAPSSGSSGGNRPTWTGTQTVQPGQKTPPPKTTPPPKKQPKSSGLIDI